MLRTLSSTFRVSLAFMFAVLSSGLLPMYASAYVAPAQGEILAHNDEVTICHATSAQNNFYITNEPNANSLEDEGHNNHTGPVYDGVMTSGWGDIIPPFQYQEPGKNGEVVTVEGQNWTDAGKAIYEKDCKVTTPPVADPCEANFIPATDEYAAQWEITWGMQHTDTNGVPTFTMDSYGGLVSLNGGDVPTYMTNAAKWNWLYVTEANLEGRIVVYGFADGTTITAAVSADENNCPAVEWTTEEPGADFYCNPANKQQTGSIADWIPEDLKCVEFTVAKECGLLTAAVTKHPSLPYNYEVAWSEDAENIGYENTLPTSFSEDYNGGSVTVYYWLVGPEADYVTGEGRDILNYWDGEYGTVTVDTDCEENTPVIPESDYRVEVIPAEVKACGEATIGLRNVSPWYYAVAYTTDGSNPDWTDDYVVEVDNREGTSVNGPAKDVTAYGTLNFGEDENDGSVTVRYAVAAGTESDLYVGLPAGEVKRVTVDTDCEDEVTEPVINVRGDSTDVPAGPAVLSDYDMPETLPQTGTSSPLNAMIVLLIGSVTYATLYFAQPRRNTDF